VSETDARGIVAFWLARDARPLNSRLGNAIGAVTSFAGGDGAPAYYVVSLKPAGFVVVPADDEVEPIIAFSATGTYEVSPESPLGALVGKDVPKRVAWARGHPSRRDAGEDAPQRIARTKWADLKAGSNGTSPSVGLDSLSDMRVSPLVASTWNQTSGPDGVPTYNIYTPNNYPCGCVATAISQVMRYHRHPTAAIGRQSFGIYICGEWEQRDTRGGDGQGEPYHWDDMVFHPDAATTQAQREAISALTYDVGLSVHMQYCSGASGASANPSAFTSTFGYATAREASGLSANLIKVASANIDAGYPVILSISGNAPGHAVVADGYGYNAATLYHHINMGWGGYQDLWYNLPVIGASGAYTAVSGLVYDIFPKETGEILSGQVLDRQGAPLSGATVTARTADGQTVSATSNAKGIYALVGVPLGVQSVVRATKAGSTFPQRTVFLATPTNDNPSTMWNVVFQDGATLPVPSVTPQVSAGLRHSMALDADGSVFAWGYNASGEFGNGTDVGSGVPVRAYYPGETFPEMIVAGEACSGGIAAGQGYVSGVSRAWRGWTHLTPTPLAEMAAIAGLSCKYHFSMFVGTDGLVYTAGENWAGQLGDGTTTDRNGTFLPIPNLDNMIGVASGDDHGLALRADGTVWAWGGNLFGQLGDGTTQTRLSPVSVSGLPAIAAIAANDHRSLALARDGTVWVWGSGSQAMPMKVTGLSGVKKAGTGGGFGAALKADGSVWKWSDPSMPSRIEGLSGIVSLSVGSLHVLALGGDGRIWGFGDNSFGQLGDACPGTACATPVALPLRLTATGSSTNLCPILPLLLPAVGPK